MAVNVFEYLNYRDFLRDAYTAEHARHWRFSYRHLAKEGGFDASLFNKILQGKRNLTLRLVPVFAGLFCGTDREKDYFAGLVAFNQARTPSESRRCLERLVATKACRVQALARDQFEYFDQWYHAVIRELLTIYPYAGDDAALGRMVCPPISGAQAKGSIALLERLSMIRRKADGLYEQTDGFITSGAATYSTAVNSCIQQNLNVAQDVLDRFSSEERNLSTLVFSCDRETYGDLVEMGRRFRREVLARVASCKKAHRVFQLGMQLFPMSDPYPLPRRRGPRRRIRGFGKDPE